MSRKSSLDPQLKEILENLNLEDGDDALLAEPSEDDAHRLRALYRRLNNGRERALRPGQLAIWKPGLKNRRFPAYGQPAIVVEALDPPVLEHEMESGAPYFREPLDLLLGILHPEGDFLVYHFDSRRFQPLEDDGAENR
jgi:hypothetical protein